MESDTIGSSLTIATSSYNVATPEIVVKNDAMSGQRSVVCADAKINMPGPNTPAVALKMREITSRYFSKLYDNMNLKNPKTFNEKIVWLRRYDRPELKTRLNNKLWVRDYIKDKIGEQYLVKLLGVYNNLEELDFDKLPDQFVLKRTYGATAKQVLVVPDKSTLDISKTKETVAKWLKNKGQVIAEEYLTNGNNDLYDYKLFCSSGKVITIGFHCNRHYVLTQAFFDTSWDYQPFSSGKKLHPHPDTIVKPNNLSVMLEVARTLSKDFPFVRVDLYHLNDGTVKFGELTFINANGQSPWNPADMNLKLGEMITLPAKSPINK